MDYKIQEAENSEKNNYLLNKKNLNLNEIKSETSIIKIFQNLPRNEIILLSFLLIFSMQSALYNNGLSFWFLSSPLKCFDNNLKLYISCSEQEACESKNYIFEKNNLSMVSKYNLICEKKLYKATIIAIMIATELIATAFFTFYRLRTDLRQYFLGITMLISSVFSFLIYFTESFLLSTLELLIINITVFCIYVNLYTFGNEYFSDDIKKIIPALLNIFWGLSTISYSYVNYICMNFQKATLIFTGIIGLFISISFLYFIHFKNIQPHINEDSPIKIIKTNKKPPNFTRMIKNKTIRKNLKIFAFVWGISIASQFGIFIDLETLFGDIYFNMYCLGLMEAISSIFAGKFVLLFNLKKIIKINILVIALSMISFIFLPTEINNITVLIQILIYLPMIIAKIGIELHWNFLTTYMQDLVYVKYHQQFFNSVELFSAIFALFVPYYSELMRFILISPFFRIWGFIFYRFFFYKLF